MCPYCRLLASWAGRRERTSGLISLFRQSDCPTNWDGIACASRPGITLFRVHSLRLTHEIRSWSSSISRTRQGQGCPARRSRSSSSQHTYRNGNLLETVHVPPVEVPSNSPEYVPPRFVCLPSATTPQDEGISWFPLQHHLRLIQAGFKGISDLGRACHLMHRPLYRHPCVHGLRRGGLQCGPGRPGFGPAHATTLRHRRIWSRQAGIRFVA